MQNAGAGAAGSGNAAVTIAGAVAIDAITAIAHIDPGAVVTSGADVTVAAGRTYREVALGLGGSRRRHARRRSGFAVPC